MVQVKHRDQRQVTRDQRPEPPDQVRGRHRDAIGIDVGGTFTDFVWLVDGQLRVFKESTTPADQSIAILRGLEALGVAKDTDVVHGTTVATNALLEHRGARTALLTTAGFADVLAIGRQNRPHLYRLAQRRPPPLVPAELRFEIEERVDAEGNVLIPLKEADVVQAVERMRREDVESVAIVFLFSFLNRAHEERAREIVERLAPGVHVSVSSALLPEYREYERTATTVINAYVQPLVARYFDRLKTSLGRRSIHVMQSSGGVIGLDEAADEAARLVLSGPAGGLVGAFEIAKLARNTDSPRIVTFDMGGTSTDVALCPGELPRTAESEIAGLPLRFPSADIHTVGAGGGSIARIDGGGVLRVGPESAGAEPGPACYGRGGTEPTVTDANVALGRLRPAGPMGGAASFELDEQAAHRSMELLGSRLNLSAEEAALGVVRVANATMERALRRVSIEQGHDPRDYELVPFGGAGSLHACELAEALGISRVMIPHFPGVLSALGMLMADVTYDTSVAVLRAAHEMVEDPSLLEPALAGLEAQVRRMFLEAPDRLRLTARLDMRYAGQSYEIEAPLELPLSGENLREAVSNFHLLHERRYGYTAPAQVEVVTLRLEGTVPGTRPDLSGEPATDTSASSAIIDETQAWFDGRGWGAVPRYDREKFRHGHYFEGPALVVQYDATIWIPPPWKAEIDAFRNVSLQRVENEF